MGGLFLRLPLGCGLFLFLCQLLQVGRIHVREHPDQRSLDQEDRPRAERCRDQARGDPHRNSSVLQNVPHKQKCRHYRHAQKCQIAGSRIGQDHHRQLDGCRESIGDPDQRFLSQDHVHTKAQQHYRRCRRYIDVAPHHHGDAFSVVLQTQSRREGEEFHSVVFPHAPRAEHCIDRHSDVDHSLEGPLRALPAHQGHEREEDENRHREHEEPVVVELEQRLRVQSAAHRAPQYIPQEHQDQHDLFKRAHPPEHSADSL